MQHNARQREQKKEREGKRERRRETEGSRKENTRNLPVDLTLSPSFYPPPPRSTQIVAAEQVVRLWLFSSSSGKREGGATFMSHVRQLSKKPTGQRAPPDTPKSSQGLTCDWKLWLWLWECFTGALPGCGTVARVARLPYENTKHPVVVWENLSNSRVLWQSACMCVCVYVCAYVCVTVWGS